MRVAVIDVGSNTIRLLVAVASERGLGTVEGRQARVGLGAGVEERGRLSEAKISEAAIRRRGPARDVSRQDRIVRTQIYFGSEELEDFGVARLVLDS